MKRLLCVLLTVTMVLSLSACDKQSSETVQDTGTVSMLVASGNGEAYFTSLAALIQEDLGIETEFVYLVSRDTTDMTRLYAANNDLPADIVFTSSKTEDNLLKGCCVDLLAKSSVTSLFTSTVQNECTTEDGAIYQLPITSRLIGITYNETLLNELGAQVPETFDDMVALKQLCDEKGVKFAVSDGVATGHGFNWLFHLMGSQYLSTPGGTAWLEEFQNGESSVDEFKAQCEYFQKWYEAGLFGSFHNQDWSGSKEFSQTRALFWYSLTNSMAGYEGPMLDEEGNETGVMLNDTYKSMPWISENGSNNCYTYYDSCWVCVNKNLESDSEKLAKVFQILEYLTQEKATQLVTDMAKDTYVAINKFSMGEDRLYAAYSKQIQNGFVQPWYYNDFDMDSIVFTGEKVNAYLAGTGSFDDIFTTLEETNQNQLNQTVQVLAEFSEKLDYENTAKLAAISCATALDMMLEEAGSEERVDVTIFPYATDEKPLQPFKSTAISSSVVYQGEFDASMILTLFPSSGEKPVGIHMTGKEIKALTEKGYDPSDRFVNAETGESTFDSSKYGPYPYVVLVKDGATLVDDQEYLVALCERSITNAEFSAFSESGKVLTNPENLHTLEEGMKQLAAEHPTISISDLTW